VESEWSFVIGQLFLGWILVYIEKYTTFATLFDYTKNRILQ